MSWLETVGVRRHDAEVVIAIDGDDARTWWNGQTTNDLKGLSATSSVYALALTTKGRILADVLSFEREGALFFATSRAAWPALHEQLERYIIMEDVVLRETDLCVVTIAGARAGALDLSAVLIGHDVTVVESTRLGAARELIGPTATLDALWPALLAAAAREGGGALDEAAWEAARIASGVPRFGVDFGDKTYPQEAGLKARALSFSKGCYLGQEVVCMLENRGQLSRSLTQLTIPEGVRAGMALRRGDDVVGEITSAAGTRGLGLVKRALAEPGVALDSDAGGVEVLRVVS